MWEAAHTPSVEAATNAVSVAAAESVGSPVSVPLSAPSATVPVTLPPGAIAARSDWFLEQVEARLDAQAALTVLYEDYCRVLKSRGATQIMTLTAFRGWLNELGLVEQAVKQGPVTIAGVLLRQRNP
jgi:hypothetical protein